MTELRTRNRGKLARFADVCERIDYGFTASADFSVKEPRLLRITDIQDGAVEWATVPGCEITAKEEEENQLLVGDVVFARTGATTGKSFLIRHAPRAVFASYLIRLRMGKEVLPEYFAAFCQSELYWRQVNREMRGSAQGGVNSTLLGSLVLPVPTLPEQKRIAVILERADRLRRLRRYGLEMVDHILPAVFIRLFGDPVANPNAWPHLPFEEVAPSRLGKMLDAKQQTGEHARPYLRNENVQWDRFDLADISVMDFDEGDREEFLLSPGDLMICEGGEPGRCAIWRGEIGECYFQKALHRARPIPSIATPEYLLYLMRSLAQRGGFEDHVTSATIAHLTGEKLKQMHVPIPPLAMQQKFTVTVRRVTILRSVHRESLRQAEHLLQTLLHRAFTGGL